MFTRHRTHGVACAGPSSQGNLERQGECSDAHIRRKAVWGGRERVAVRMQAQGNWGRRGERSDAYAMNFGEIHSLFLFIKYSPWIIYCI